MTKEKIIEAAKAVWSAGDMYIGPSFESLQAFAEPLLKRIEEWKQVAKENLQGMAICREQLAASHAENVKLRAALGKAKEGLVQWHVPENRYAALDVITEALAQPTDTSALQQAIDAAYERAARFCDERYEACYEREAKEIAEAIRTLKGTS